MYEYLVVIALSLISLVVLWANHRLEQEMNRMEEKNKQLWKDIDRLINQLADRG